MQPDEKAPSAASSDPWLLRYAVAALVGGMVVALHLSRSLNGIFVPLAIPVGLLVGILGGLPTAAFLRSRGWRTLFHVLAAGALLGLVPLGVAAVIEGEWRSALTIAGWGAATALTAWTVAKAQDLPLRRLRGATRVWATVGLAIVLVVLAWFGMMAVIQAMRGPPDLSCHNPLRDGRKSVSAAATASLLLTEADWPRFRQVMNEVAKSDGWSLRDYPRPQAIGGTLCQEVGTQIRYRQWTWSEQPDKEMQIIVIAPQGGDAWRPSVARVLERLEREWPGALKVKDRPWVLGSPSSRPAVTNRSP